MKARSAGTNVHGVQTPVIYTAHSLHHTRGLVVQLVRMPACHAGGREFESLPGRHLYAQANSHECVAGTKCLEGIQSTTYALSEAERKEPERFEIGAQSIDTG